jgi:hypothetical protein
MKPFTDSQFAFKAAVRRAVKMCGGPNAAADVVRVDAARLSRYGNPDCPEFAPIDVCFVLDKAAGKPVIFDAWADLAETANDLASDVMNIAGGIAKESGELISTAIEATADGKLTINEAKAIDERAADLQDKVVDIRAAARKSMVGQ